MAIGCQDIKHQILVTDQEEMFSLMEHNIQLNGVEDRAKAMLLNWYALFFFFFFFFPTHHFTCPRLFPALRALSLFPPDAVTPDGRYAEREVRRVVVFCHVFPSSFLFPAR